MYKENLQTKITKVLWKIIHTPTPIQKEEQRKIREEC